MVLAPDQIRRAGYPWSSDINGFSGHIKKGKNSYGSNFIQRQRERERDGDKQTRKTCSKRTAQRFTPHHNLTRWKSRSPLGRRGKSTSSSMTASELAMSCLLEYNFNRMHLYTRAHMYNPVSINPTRAISIYVKKPYAPRCRAAKGSAFASNGSAE
jgi:hypothetical protein